MSAVLDGLVSVAALLLLILTPLLALTAQLVAMGVRRDTGDHWARMTALTAAACSLVLCSGWLETVWPTAFIKGWHLQWDRAQGFFLEPRLAYLLALALPVLPWALALSLSALWRGERERARWLAGAVGEHGRAWVAWLLVPLLVSLCWPLFRGDLHSGVVGHPAAAFTAQTLLFWCLCGLAWSGAEPELAPAETRPEPVPSLQDWPTAMRSLGIALETLWAWPATDPSTEQELPAPLLREVEALLRAPGGQARLILGPDHAGQLEAVAWAVRRICLAHQAALVIVEREPGRLASKLSPLLPVGLRVAALEEGTPSSGAEVIVLSAELLSDRLSQVLHASHLLERLGLVVWWDAHDYTGVEAANVWAVSRRFQRLLLSGRPEGIRALIFAQQAQHGRAQLGRFLRRLLPYALPDEHVVHLETRFVRPVELHLVTGHRDFLESETLHAKISHQALATVLASTKTGWPTYLSPLADIDNLELASILARQRQPDQAGQPTDGLEPRLARADARILELSASDVLSLRESIASGGRLGHEEIHHIALLPPRSSYVRWLLQLLAREGTMGTSKRLVCSYGNERITARHIVSALLELPDTRGRLVQTFQWEEGALRRILDELARQGQLDQQEIRYLDEAGEVQSDMFYQSRQTVQIPRQPLHTVGGTLVEVREFATADQRQVRLYVDRERLPIAAYPERRFMDRGRRYRITDGDVLMDGATPYVQCEHDENLSHTWRIRRGEVDDLRVISGPVWTRANGGQPIGRYQLEVRYEECVTGALVQVVDPQTGPREPVPTHYRERRTAYQAHALLIDFPGAPSVQLASVAAALVSVIPVHIGVADDALALVWVLDQQVGEHNLHGLAIVDLFPGGIGLVDAFWQENELLLDLLRFAYRWLAECPCNSDTGCPLCVRTPEAKASFPDGYQTRAAATALLGQIVGGEQ